MKIELEINGTLRSGEVEPRATLLDALRDEFLLTGTHAGCEHGVCGACTVLLDGEPVRSCLMFAVQVDGYAICAPSRAWRRRRIGSACCRPRSAATTRCNAASAPPAS